MNNLIKVIIFISIIFIDNVVASINKEKVYNVAVFKNWMPYYSVDPNGKASGFSVDLFEAIAKDIGIQYKYKVIDEWSDFWDLLQKGEVDIIPDMGVSDKRKTSLLFSQSTNTFAIKIYKRIHSKHLKSLKDFKNTKIAVVERNIGVTLIKRIPNILIVEYKNRFDAFYALLAGEVDGLCYPQPLIEYLLKKLNLEDKVESIDENIYEIKRAVGVVSSNSVLLEKINSSFAKLQKNGTYDLIYQKWFGKEKSLEFSYEQIIYTTIMGILIMVGLLSLIIFYSIRKKWLMTEDSLKQELDVRTKDLLDANKKLEELATIDVLTGIYNRRYFFDMVKQYLEIAKRNKSKLCVISFDLDKFKNINDTYGHQSGDKVLIEFTNIVNAFMRKSDVFARIGGEEFAILMQNTNIENTVIVCEKIRKKIEKSIIKDKEKTINFSVSIGIVEFTIENNIDELLEKADIALYKAKENGRNQVVEYK